MNETSGSPLATLAAQWPVPARVTAFTTTRNGGVSQGAWGGGSPSQRGLNLGLHCGDRPEDVLANRERLRRLLPAEPKWMTQVHGVDVAEFGDESVSTMPTADAAITLVPGVVLAVLTADCMPVFFGNAEGDAVGICHAGWRGMAGGVIEATIERLRRRRPGARGWHAFMGPTIGPRRFEVGEDVLEAFHAADPGSSAHFTPREQHGKYLADLYGLAARRLHRAGLNSVGAAAYCCHEDGERFYSYRRDRICGRMASVIWIQAAR